MGAWLGGGDDVAGLDVAVDLQRISVGVPESSQVRAEDRVDFILDDVEIDLTRRAGYRSAKTKPLGNCLQGKDIDRLDMSRNSTKAA